MIEIKFSGESLADIEADFKKLGGALVMASLQSPSIGVSIKPASAEKINQLELPIEEPIKRRGPGRPPKAEKVEVEAAITVPAPATAVPAPQASAVADEPQPSEDDARVALVAVTAKHGIDAGISVNKHFGVGKIRELEASKLKEYILYCKKIAGGPWPLTHQ